MPSRYSVNRYTEDMDRGQPSPGSGSSGNKPFPQKPSPYNANIGPSQPGTRNKVGFRKVKAYPKSQGL